jgi:hypothetical protein
MSGSTVGIVLIPIVVAVMLFAWIFMVFRADRRPEAGGRRQVPDRGITGGIFHGDPRQVSPRRTAPPVQTAPERAATAGNDARGPDSTRGKVGGDGG